jgi:hypothetical protein
MRKAFHGWQHWLVETIRMFLHPEARAFDKSRKDEARQWVLGLNPFDPGRRPG